MPVLDVLKILIIPLLIAGALYGLTTYVLLPLYRAHRQRYGQYLPLDGLSARTEGVRGRVQEWLMRVILPRSLLWRRDRAGAERMYAVDEEDVAEEEGENMVGFDLGRGTGGRTHAGG